MQKFNWSNTWVLPVDIKFKYSAKEPIFRRKDTAVLNFLIHDNHSLYDISSFKEGEVTIVFPRGHNIKKPCKKVTIEGTNYIQFAFTQEDMSEIGKYGITLSFRDDRGQVSIQEFPIYFFDSLGKTELAYIELIQDLQAQKDILGGIIDQIVNKNHKGIANGLAELDSNGKIAEKHMPNYMREHINKNVYLDWVHGLFVDKDGTMKYRTKDGGEENVGHQDTGTKLTLSITVANGVATLNYTGKGTAVLQKWMYGDQLMDDIKAKGTIFTGNTFKVDKVGVYTVYYKDDNSMEHIYKFNVREVDLKEPDVKVTAKNGDVTVTSDTKIVIYKYAKGHFDIPYFATAGTTFSGTFKVAEVGEYTIYVKLEDGRERVYYLNVKDADLEHIDNEPPTINFTLTPSNTTETNSDKSLAIAIVDANKVVDKRFYFNPYSANPPVTPTIDKFKGDANFGTKMTTNTYNYIVKENGRMYVYAKDEFGNDTMQQFYINSIDKVGAYDVTYEESFNIATKRYDIKARISTTQTLKEIKYPSGAIIINENMHSGDVTYSVASTTKHNIIVTDVLGNRSTFEIVLRGKIKYVYKYSNSTFTLHEDGSMYVRHKNFYSTNAPSWMGLGENVKIESDKFYKVPLTEKIDRFYSHQGGCIAFSAVGNSYIWGEPKGVGLGVKYPSGTQIWKPTLLNDSMYALDVIMDEWNYMFKKSDSKWYGMGDTTTAFGNNYEGSKATPDQLAKSITISRVDAVGARAWYYASNGKLYASGWNDSGVLGVPYSLPFVFPDLRECTTITAKGTVKKAMSSHSSLSYFSMSDGKMYCIGQSGMVGDEENKALTVTGYPTDDAPVSYSDGYGGRVILSTKGVPYVNGDNLGYLGVGHSNPISAKTFVKVPVDKKMIQASMIDGLLLLSENGEVVEGDKSTSGLKDTTKDYMFAVKATKL